MFREMRRKKQALPDSEAAAVLRRATSGVLALLGDGGYPYAVPLSFVFDSGSLYFHCAKEGHKLDAVRGGAKASFCVIEQDKVVPEAYTTYYRSVIVFGEIRVMEDGQKAREALEKLAVRYAPEDTPAGRQSAIDREWNATAMLELRIHHMTGKEAIELARECGAGKAL